MFSVTAISSARVCLWRHISSRNAWPPSLRTVKEHRQNGVCQSLQFVVVEQLTDADSYDILHLNWMLTRDVRTLSVTRLRATHSHENRGA